MKEEISLEELKRKVVKYIEEDDYAQATCEKEKLVKNMKDEYIGYLLNEIGIMNESIVRYSVNSIDQISLEIQQMLKERKDGHIDTKVQIIQNESGDDEEENLQRNVNVANERMEETQKQIDYEDKIKQIITDEINDAINQAQKTLDNIGVRENKIEEISDALHEKRNELCRYSLKFSEILTDLDKKMTEFVQSANEDYMQEILNQKDGNTESKFKDSLEVDNSKNQIEEKALENMANSLNNKNKEQEKEGLSPDEIFGEGKKQTISKSEIDGLDASDIF